MEGGEEGDGEHLLERSRTKEVMVSVGLGGTPGMGFLAGLSEPDHIRSLESVM